MSLMQSVLLAIREFFVPATRPNAVQTWFSRVLYPRLSWPKPDVSWARPNYDFWRRAYRGQVQGLGLSGLLIRPIVDKIAAWSLAQPPEFSCDNQRTQRLLNEWWEKHHGDILLAWRSALKHGDAFIVIEPDLSVTRILPDFVDAIIDEDNPAVISGWRVTIPVSKPDGRRIEVIDEYTKEVHVSIRKQGGFEVSRKSHPNVIGVLPIVHIANRTDEHEIFGHPEAEGLLELLHKYGWVMDAAIEGNVMQGRPTPWINFKNQMDLDSFWNKYGQTVTQTLPDGRVETTTAFEFDVSKVLLTSDAEFSYKSPGSFTQDTLNILQILFYLLLEHTQLPEFVFGNAIQASRASAETQLPVFVKFIDGVRRGMEYWMLEISQIVLAYMNVTRRVSANTKIQILWPQLLKPDGKLTLATISWLYHAGALDRRTALMLSPVEVKNIDDILSAAEEERGSSNQVVPPPVQPGYDSDRDSMAITSGDQLGGK